MYDRGTKFGLNTPNVEIENVLMSLPLTCSWRFKYKLKNDKEKAVLKVLKNPVDWINHPVAKMSRQLSVINQISLSYSLLLLSNSELKQYLSKNMNGSKSNGHIQNGKHHNGDIKNGKISNGVH